MSQIDRQAAIEALYSVDEYNPRSIKAIKDLPSVQSESKWIPCSERLPEKYGWYQVTIKDGRVSRLYYAYKSGRWIDNVRKHMFELYDIYSKRTHKRITEEKEDVYWDDWVIAWMPLPEPYEPYDYNYERTVEQLEHDILYEPTFNQDDGSM